MKNVCGNCGHDIFYRHTCTRDADGRVISVSCRNCECKEIQDGTDTVPAKEKA